MNDELVTEVGSSLLEQLREKRRAAAAAKTIDLPIPGYDGDLIARYRLLDVLVDGKQLGEKIRREFTSQTERTFYGALDTLITACEGLYIRNQASGELEPLDPDGQGPVCYDHRLAEGLELEASTARETLKALFNGEEVRILTHADQLGRWMADPASAVTLGEA